MINETILAKIATYNINNNNNIIITAVVAIMFQYEAAVKYSNEVASKFPPSDQ